MTYIDGATPDLRALGAASFDQLRKRFVWRLPQTYNIGVDIADKWAARTPAAPAIFQIDADGSAQAVDFARLREESNRLAHVLAASGLKAGDRIGVLAPQHYRVAVAHAAIFKLGAISVPLALLFGAEALAFRLRDCGVAAMVVDGAGLEKLRALPELPPSLGPIVCMDGASGGALGYDSALSTASPDFAAARTTPDTPALMIYTSGTTGAPKGALHGHRVLPGHLPGVQAPHEMFPQPGDRFWTPADWAWAGGLLNCLLPSLHFGAPVVARATTKFDPEAAFDLIARHGVRNVFAPPTALRMMRMVERPRERFALDLRTLGSAGEALGAEPYEWARRELGLTINEYYGQTECNLVLGSAAGLGVSRAGATGKPIPGHDVAILREDGAFCEAGETGQIAVRRPDPAMFLEYWNMPQATAEKFIGDWMKTGDQGYVDEDGYFFFVGRDDDVITSSGYRIGPGEIEDCLLRHPAVSLAAAIGKPDPLRTEIVKAFIVLRSGVTPSPELTGDIQRHVRANLAAYEYPREIDYVETLPMTTSGKIIRRLLRERG